MMIMYVDLFVIGVCNSLEPANMAAEIVGNDKKNSAAPTNILPRNNPP